MASETAARPVIEAEAPAPPALGPILNKLLAPIASLKLTVVLFALAIVLIFVGTLAQSQRDIWEVMGLYFRCFFARVELQVFFPRAWFPSLEGQVPGAFYFPGGFLIGGGLFLNLLAAHAVRFKVQAKGARLAWGLLVIALGVALTTLVILLGNDQGAVSGELFHEWPSLRILWQLFKGLLAGGVLLAGCWLVFRKRAGIVLLHVGVGLMMANELVVHLLHEEGQMFIPEGHTVNYLQDVRTVELAVVDPSPADHDDVVVVPRELLTAGVPIEHADLPFKIEVGQYLQNAVLVRPDKSAENPATAGTGLKWLAQPTPASTGADAGEEVDSAAAYVTLRARSDNRPLGVYLLSVVLLQPQKVEVQGKTYEVALRFKRNYRPYSVNLVDVRKDDYLGTDTPRNYSSDVRLVDLERKTDITPHISMNNPLRYTSDRIETFYQSSYQLTAEGEATTLQVVTNTAWMIPYVACMIVMVGMLAQFSGTLVRFLERVTQGRYGAAEAPPPTGRRKQKRSRRDDQSDRPEGSRGRRVWGFGLAGFAALLCGMWIVSLARPPKQPEGEPNLADFGRLPVVYEGRVKPFDTLARNALKAISGRQTFADDKGKRQPAVRWLLDVISDRRAATAHKVFYIENYAVLDILRLKPRPGFRYAVDEFRDRMAELDTQAAAAHQVPTHKLSLEQRKVLELEQKLRLYITLLSAFDLPPIRQESAAQDLLAAIQQQQAEEQMQLKAKLFPPRMVPPAAADEQWETYKRAWTKGYAQLNFGQKPNPHLVFLGALLVAYEAQDKPGARSEAIGQFNSRLREYSQGLAASPPADLDRARVDWEAFYNRFEPLFYPILLYVAAFLIAVMSWLFWFWNRPLNRMALAVILCGLSLHTFGLILRIWISGRPPVTNLYSSAIFIAWGAVVFGIAIEYLFRLGLGNAIAGVGGSVALWIAHNLAADGDTFTVMQAVLDTNFWLATHVSCITFGYVATYVAGLLGLAYIVGGLVTPAMGVKVDGGLTVGKLVHVATYGVLCFAILFSFVGTVLGGLWADDSWGRFWGWDPKENGALIIVIWNALALHARWGGMVKERGLAALVVFGNVVTSWSWFGVNELGVGLHSYGFTDGVLLALSGFAASQLAVIGFSQLPRRLWWSFRNQPA